MYNNHHQGHNNNLLIPSRGAFPADKHLFLQGGSVQGESGLVLSTDAKPRLKWTPELHERFIEAVNHLGGADKATPKTIMRLMGIPGLTLYHLKSHLQKYRLSKNLQTQSNSGGTKNIISCTVATDRTLEGNGVPISDLNIASQTQKTMQISEALQMQIEVQRRLHEQLEVQRHLQLRIEAQGKYLQSVLEKAHETLAKQNLGSAPGLQAAKAQLSELVSKVSTECLHNAFTFEDAHRHAAQFNDGSVDSCLTSCEGSQKEQELHTKCKRTAAEDINSQANLWFRDSNKRTIASASAARDQDMKDYHVQRDSGMLSIGLTAHDAEEMRGNVFEARRNDHPCLATQLDLNANYSSDAAPNCKKFDLNGVSWT